MVGAETDSSRLRDRVFVVVVAVWVVNFAAGLIPALEYEPDPMINGIFMSVAGSIYFVASFRKPPEGGSS